MLKRGYRDVFQFDVNPWLIQLKRAANEWKNNQLSETLEDLEFAAYYPFSIVSFEVIFGKGIYVCATFLDTKFNGNYGSRLRN